MYNWLLALAVVLWAIYLSLIHIYNVYLTTILKIIGITYVAEFGAQICRDSGQGALATKVELAAKVIIMMMAVPIMAAILDAVWKLLP